MRLEIRYCEEIEKWKARFTEADIQNGILQRENALLAQDLKDHQDHLEKKDHEKHARVEHEKRKTVTHANLKNFEV